MSNVSELKALLKTAKASGDKGLQKIITRRIDLARLEETLEQARAMADQDLVVELEARIETVKQARTDLRPARALVADQVEAVANRLLRWAGRASDQANHPFF